MLYAEFGRNEAASMYSIGVFTNELSLQRILKLNDLLSQRSYITYLPYTSPDDLRFLYEENQGKFDALLFSGSYPYNVIRKFFPQVADVPHAYFDLSPVDYYKAIAALAIQHPGLDFTRVYFDRPQVPVDFKSIFLQEDAPRLGTAPIDWPNVDAPDWYVPLQEYYKQLWDSGTIDLLVTRFASMGSYFDTHSIRHQYLYPSQETMLETYQDLLHQLDASAMRAAAACVALIDVPKTLTQQEQQTLWERLQQFNRQSGMPFLTYRLPNRFEITSNTSTLKELTQQYTTCPLISFLTEKLSVPICIGWGSAGNISEAYQNGLRALKQATLYGDCATFISLENNVMIGPLSSTQRMVYNDIPDKNLIQISERVGISPLYLNKILYIIQQKQGNTLSSEELSFFLNVTTRSASRILKKLEEGGLARVEYNRQLNFRGRPAKIYTIDRSKLESGQAL